MRRLCQKGLRARAGSTEAQEPAALAGSWDVIVRESRTLRVSGLSSWQEQLQCAEMGKGWLGEITSSVLEPRDAH